MSVSMFVDMETIVSTKEGKLVKSYGSAVYGIEALKITIELTLSVGMKFILVGLPDNAVKESYERIKSALLQSGLRMPGFKITVNMSPADLRKEGACYDLPIALAILAANEDIPHEPLEDYMIMGELSMDGSVLPIQGALPITIKAKEAGFKGVIVPKRNVEEAGVVEGIDIHGVEHIKEVIDFFNDEGDLEAYVMKPFSEQVLEAKEGAPDFSEVKGQENVKRALEIAAAGGHNILLIGPPGVGKTMLAKRIPSILPPLSLEEALETTKIHSVAGTLGDSTRLMTERPFRSPHHTVSDVALVGGGTVPRPGEISLAHNGILFLDELPEFKRQVLEVLRQPLEDRVISIARARFSVNYPSSFMLVASMNPSPSGDFFDPETSKDSEESVQRYLNRVSGPLMDRIDLHIEVSPVPYDDLSNRQPGEPSRNVRERVIASRDIQTRRFDGIEGVHCNAQLSPALMREYCRVDDAGDKILKQAVENLGFSARSYARILKVARTIADLDHSADIKPNHIAEAIQYRSLDRKGFEN